MDVVAAFTALKAAYLNKELFPEFEEYLKTAQSNGVRKEARYFSFLLRTKYGFQTSEYTEIQKYYQEKQNNFWYELHWGEVPQKAKDANPELYKLQPGERRDLV
ncbi:MAG: hypothetical protein WCG20_01510 [bacterium]